MKKREVPQYSLNIKNLGRARKLKQKVEKCILEEQA
jgi:hypothetical protein